MRIATLRSAVFGGGLFRIGAGAVPFLFPLMLQLGFGYSAFESGLISAVSIGGALTMKIFAKPALKRFGFRTVLVGTAVIGGAMMAMIGLYRPETPLPVLVLLLLIGGFFRSLFFTSINVIAFADVPQPRTGDATAILAAFQQVSIAAGVAVAGAILELGLVLRGASVPDLGDFSLAFYVVGATTVLAALFFLRLPADAGAEMAGRRAPAK